MSEGNNKGDLKEISVYCWFRGGARKTTFRIPATAQFVEFSKHLDKNERLEDVIGMNHYGIWIKAKE